MCVKYNDSRILRLRRFKTRTKFLDAIKFRIQQKTRNVNTQKMENKQKTFLNLEFKILWW